jgi:hypothetical protein
MISHISHKVRNVNFLSVVLNVKTQINYLSLILLSIVECHQHRASNPIDESILQSENLLDFLISVIPSLVLIHSIFHFSQAFLAHKRIMNLIFLILFVKLNLNHLLVLVNFLNSTYDSK